MAKLVCESLEEFNSLNVDESQVLKEYQIGKEYKFAQPNGNIGYLKIVKQEGNNYTFTRDVGGYVKTFKVSKEWLDKNVR